MKGKIMEDETNPEETQEDASLASEQTTDDIREDEKTLSDKGSVPYERFSEVNQEKNDLREELGDLKGKLETLEAKEPEEEPSDWQEAEKRTVNKATAQMRSELKAEAEKDQAEEVEIERGFSQLKQMGQEVSQETKKAVLEKMIETGKDVYETYIEVKGHLDGEVKANQLKTEGQIPSSQKGSEATPAFDYKSIQGKTPMDVVREG